MTNITTNRLLFNQPDKLGWLCKPEGTGTIPVFSTMQATLPKTARFVINSKGKKTSVLLPMDALDELLKDAFDGGVARSRLDDEDASWDEAMKAGRSKRVP